MTGSSYWLIGIEGVVIRDDDAARVRVALSCVLRRRVVACAREASSHIGEDLLELWLWLKDADRVSRCVARHLVLPGMIPHRDRINSFPYGLFDTKMWSPNFCHTYM